MSTPDIQNLKKILTPVIEGLAAEAPTALGEVILVVHKPRGVAVEALRKLGLIPETEDTCAYAGAHLVDGFTDGPTRRWLAAPPEPHTVKIFLIAGEGTALLTLDLTDPDKVIVRKQADLYLVK